MRFDVGYLLEILPRMRNSFVYTLFVIIATYAISFSIGAAITAVRLKKVPVISQVCEVWLSFVRSMPILVTMFLIYFTLPSLLALAGIRSDWSLTSYILVAMSFQYSPFFSEVLRPSYLAVERGQHEAAVSIGMTGFQALWRVTAPQALQVALPQLGSTALRITGDSSLMFTIGVIDLMGQADIQIVTSYGLHKLESFVAVAICYWLLTFGVMMVTWLLEKRCARFHIQSSIKA